MRWCFAVLAMAGCVPTHDQALREVRSSDDCVVCHDDEAAAVVTPVHATLPRSCGDCHQQRAWRPALEGPHPEPRFPIAAGAHQLRCLDCHHAELGPSAGGGNTDCVACHPEAPMADSHGGVAAYLFDGGNPRFCLTCHPDGTAPKHPEDRFPIRAGHHAGLPCGSCHVAALGPSTGGMNTSCVGCHEHSQTRSNEQHREVGGYVFDAGDPHFCLSCHPRGGDGD